MRLMAISEAAAIPLRENPLSEDEVLGYDEFGIPKCSDHRPSAIAAILFQEAERDLYIGDCQNGGT